MNRLFQWAWDPVHVTPKKGRDKENTQCCLVVKFGKTGLVMIWDTVADDVKTELVFWEEDNWCTIRSVNFFILLKLLCDEFVMNRPNRFLFPPSGD